MRKYAAALVAVLAVPTLAHAQKKVLTQADWDKWKSINAPALSNDGKWAIYTLIPQVGDGELVIRSTFDLLNEDIRIQRLDAVGGSPNTKITKTGENVPPGSESLWQQAACHPCAP